MKELFDKISNDTFTEQDLENLDINILNEDGWNIFMYACEQDKEEVVNLLLSKGAQVEVFGQDFHPLLFIVENNNTNLFDKVISQVKTPLNDITDEEGNSIVQIAAKKGHFDISQKIIKNTNDFSHRNNKGENILFSILNSYELTNEQIDSLSSQVIEKFNLKDSSNISFNEVDLGKLVAVKNLGLLFTKLIDEGYPFSQFSTQEELFNLATDNKSVNSISILIDNGVEASIADIEKLEKIIIEKENAHQIFDYLKTNYYFKSQVNTDSEENFLLELIKAKKLELAQEIVDLGWGINVTNKKMDTPLLLAIKAESTELVSSLLEQGANVTEITQQGNSPLLLAVALENNAIVNILLDNVFVLQSTEHQNENGYTALTLAIQRRNFEIVEKLLFKGVDIVFKEEYQGIDIEEEVQFLEEESRFKVDSLNALVQLGFDINAKDSNDRTILIHNVIKKKEGNIRAILDLYGIDATLEDKFEKNALDYALENRDLTSIGLLINNGVKEFKTKGRTSVLKTFSPDEEKDLSIISYLFNSEVEESIKMDLISFLFEKNFSNFESFKESLNIEAQYDFETCVETTNCILEKFIIESILHNKSELIDEFIDNENIRAIDFYNIEVPLSFSLSSLNIDALNYLQKFDYFNKLSEEERNNAFFTLLENEVNDSIKHIIKENLLDMSQEKMGQLLQSDNINNKTSTYEFFQETFKPSITDKINNSRKTSSKKPSKNNLEV